MHLCTRTVLEFPPETKLWGHLGSNGAIQFLSPIRDCTSLNNDTVNHGLSELAVCSLHLQKRSPTLIIKSFLHQSDFIVAQNSGNPGELLDTETETETEIISLC